MPEDVVRFYRDAGGQWRWQRIRDGKIVDDPGDGHMRLEDAQHEAHEVNGEDVVYEDLR